LNPGPRIKARWAGGWLRRRAPWRPFQPLRQLLVALIHGYRLLLKPWIGNTCRFEPSCSSYALQALQRHGAGRGSLLAGWRILRCQPWCAGGHDPVPEQAPRLFTGLVQAVRPRRPAARPDTPERHLPSSKLP
jgi:putative membrane protein insertion efficiency factor